MQPTELIVSPSSLIPHGNDSVPRAVPGGFWLRFVALIVDTSILGVLTFPIGFLSGASSVLENTRGVILSYILKAACGLLYTSMFYKRRGATPGKLIFGLRVVDSDTGLYIGVGRTLLRDYVGKSVGAALLLAGFIMAGFRSDKRALHDFLANTRVIRIL